MSVWVITNPGPNAVGCPHPRPNPQEGRVDLQLDGFDFTVVTTEELALWRLSPGFQRLESSGVLVISEHEPDSIPKRKPDLPASLRPDNDYDRGVAYQIAMAPDNDHANEMTLAKINVFRLGEDGLEWSPDADTTYLKTRHLSILRAVEWYLTKYVERRSKAQNQRLRDARRQIRAITALL